MYMYMLWLYGVVDTFDVLSICTDDYVKDRNIHLQIEVHVHVHYTRVYRLIVLKDLHILHMSHIQYI